MKLTDEDIVKALENNLGFTVVHTGISNICQATLDLIHRLQEENEWLKKRKIEPKIFHCHADAVENCPKVEQSVKDTAKEIFTKLLSGDCVIEVAQAELYGNGYLFKAVDIDTIKERAKRYGVEVE